MVIFMYFVYIQNPNHGGHLEEWRCEVISLDGDHLRTAMFRWIIVGYSQIDPTKLSLRSTQGCLWREPWWHQLARKYESS